jgi:PTS system fructose-specific IIC component
VIIAADTQVDLSRFVGKRLFSSGTKPAINDGENLVRRAIAEAQPHGASQAASSQTAASTASASSARANSAAALTNT